MDKALLRRALELCEHLYATERFTEAEELDVAIDSELERLEHHHAGMSESEDSDANERDDIYRELSALWDTWLYVHRSGRFYRSVHDRGSATRIARGIIDAYGAQSHNPLEAARLAHCEVSKLRARR